ncbi:hypothetical protein [Streptomyces sp. NPDC001568]|uniref:hypothetical protein n=1 Tax=Streptomyces sp. NPDC001568 TaxID=3364588 RepID=UPI0036CD23F1
MNDDDPSREPAEHLRFAAHLRALEQVDDADEVDLIIEVLTDPDPVMACSAVVRHLDRRATELHHGPAWDPWAASIAPAAAPVPFLTGRLREWTLLRAIALRQPWQPNALLGASDWLQLKAAGAADPDALALLAEQGRTKRIRGTARAGLARQGSGGA